jgi:uncharacterized protein YsxB (DUF464 family)
MIQSTFKRDNDGDLISVELTGHAMSGDYGHDIVCAGVSALAINAINSLEALSGVQPLVDVDEVEGGYLYIEINPSGTAEQMNITQLMLESFLLGMTSIEEEYGQYVKVINVSK